MRRKRAQVDPDLSESLEENSAPIERAYNFQAEEPDFSGLARSVPDLTAEAGHGADARKQIHRVQQKIANLPDEDEADLVSHLRFPKRSDSLPPPTSGQEKALVEEIALATAARLQENYKPGFGVFPSAHPNDNFFNMVWTRDFGQAAGNYFAVANPQAIEDSLATILSHQRPDGALPFRVQREYLMTKFIPLIGIILSKVFFDLYQRKLKGNDELPLYEGQGGSGAEDTVPVTIIAAGEFFIGSEKGKEFIKAHYQELVKAVDFFRAKIDPEDGLAIIKHDAADWADSLKRSGKLGGINIFWARALRMMAYMAKELGHEDEAEKYKDEFRKVKDGIMAKIYNSEEGYFKAAEDDDRVDTTASIFGSLYLLNPSEAARVEETLAERVKHSSGLKNFDPPYPQDHILRALRIVGHSGYHNQFVWPWVTCENIQVKVKIALHHTDEKIREQYKNEAVRDLLEISVLFKKLGGAYEIVFPDEPRPGQTFFYRNPPKDFMGSMAAYQGAYAQLKELGWI